MRLKRFILSKLFDKSARIQLIYIVMFYHFFISLLMYRTVIVLPLISDYHYFRLFCIISEIFILFEGTDFMKKNFLENKISAFIYLVIFLKYFIK